MTIHYNFKELEKKWQHYWEASGYNKADNQSKKPKYYALSMWPYPSGKIHMGHAKNYTMSDVLARYKKSKGYNVLHPMGWDAFGLPAENAAKQNGTHPKEWTYQNIRDMKQELESLGLTIDWSREVATCDPTYYKHQQALFIEFYKKGIVGRKKSYVNWDPVDQTVLANEQVIDGRGWRSGALIERKELNQWVFKISDYSDVLLKDLEQLPEWPDKVKTMQENWIGKSSGTLIDFEIPTLDNINNITVFTTRAETIFGCSFLAISFDHPIAKHLAKQDNQLEAFIADCKNNNTTEAELSKADKIGYLLPFKATHPLTQKTIPVFVTNYVLMDFGTGAVFGCPSHDKRDFEFAKKYQLPLHLVLSSSTEQPTQEGFLEKGAFVINSHETINNKPIVEAKAIIEAWLARENKGGQKTFYRLKDWGISRQKYWGCPIPMIHCNECGIVPESLEKLPVLLPEKVDFSQPKNPLAIHSDFMNTSCPKCKQPATRETDTMDTFVDSSWYFLYFASNKEQQLQAPIVKEAVDYWLPVDRYIGGVEHAILHLLYARFINRALHEMNLSSVNEPFKGLFTQGMIQGEAFKDSDNNWVYPDDIVDSPNGKIHKLNQLPVRSLGIMTMSKSKKNVVQPTRIIEQYGTDALRMYILSDTPPEKDSVWSDKGVENTYKFLQKLFNSIANADTNLKQLTYAIITQPNLVESYSSSIMNELHGIYQLFNKIDQEYDELQYNKVIAKIYEIYNATQKSTVPEIIAFGYATLIKALYPITPHMAEELTALCQATTQLPVKALSSIPFNYPAFEFSIQQTTIIAIQINGKMRGTIQLANNASQELAIETALTNETIQKYITHKDAIKKIIYVPNKVLNCIL